MLVIIFVSVVHVESYWDIHNFFGYVINFFNVKSFHVDEVELNVKKYSQCTTFVTICRPFETFSTASNTTISCT